jgi:hypothetical protein
MDEIIEKYTYVDATDEAANLTFLMNFAQRKTN